MIRQRWLRIVLWLVAAALFAWALSRVSFTDTWDALRRFDATACIVLVLLNILALLAFGVRLWILLRGLGHPIGLYDAALYRLVAFGFSYFTPGPQVGGEPAQVLLAERRGVPRAVAIASVGLDRLFDGIVNLGFFSASALMVVDAGVGAFLSILVAVPLAYLVALSLGKTPASSILRRDVVRDSEMHAGSFCRRRPGSLALAVLASFASLLIMLAEYWLLVSFLGVKLSATQLVIGLAAARIAYLLLLPAGLGVLEAGQVTAVRAMGFPAALGLGVSLIIRLRDVIVASVGLWWGMKLLTRQQEN